MATEEIEFIDCSSLSISFDATGKASVSLTVVRNDSNSLVGSYTNKNWGGAQFDCVLMSSIQKPLIGTGGWSEWALSMEGVAN